MSNIIAEVFVEEISMSMKELDRVSLLRQVLAKQLTQVRAAQLLELSVRQVRNLLKTLKQNGPKGIVSKKRGVASNRKISDPLREEVAHLVQEKYQDFGPTLAAEKLYQNHGITLSKETVRKWMIKWHLWIPKIKKRKIHQSRSRRACFGELIQVDGSHHWWFEQRGAACVLLVFIDDATSEITAATFVEEETLNGYFLTLHKHLKKWGIPRNIYSDRFSVFETTRKKENLTQFQRALKNLKIKWIGANTAQAKGRVERVNRTLQDRLVKEMRLRSINTIEEGNRFLEEYLQEHNKKFSKEPKEAFDSHRPLEREVDLNRTLTRYEERTLSKDLCFQLHGIRYKILEPLKIDGWSKRIEIRGSATEMRVFWKSKEVLFARCDEIEEAWEKKTEWKCKKMRQPPPEHHPWKNPSYVAMLRSKDEKAYAVV